MTEMKRSILGIAFLLVLTACGGGGEAGDKGAVKDAAQKQADYFSSHDFGGVYDMWVGSAKKTITRDDYIEFAKECGLGGVPLDTKFVRFENKAGTEAIVSVGLGAIRESYTMLLEDGEWSWVPSDDSLKLYRLGVDEAVASGKQDGTCD